MDTAILKHKILKAKVKMKKRKERGEEVAVGRAEKKAFRAEKETERKVGLTERKTAALAKEREAEAALRARREVEKKELSLGRETRKARLLTERELRTAKLKPYTEAARKVGKVGLEVSKAGVGVVGATWRGLEKLGEMGKEPPKRPKRETPLDVDEIDLGFGPSRREVPRARPRGFLEGEDPLGLKPKHKGLPLDLKIDIK